MAKTSSEKMSAAAQRKADTKPANFAISKENYNYIAIGFGLMVLGFILMIGGGSKDPNVFHEDAIFSFRRITLSPLLIIAGLVFEIYAIMRKPKVKEEK
jgi:hypothetical protein